MKKNWGGVPVRVCSMLSSRDRLPGGGRCRSSPARIGEAAPITRASPGARSRIAAFAASGACPGAGASINFFLNFVKFENLGIFCTDLQKITADAAGACRIKERDCGVSHLRVCTSQECGICTSDYYLQANGCMIPESLRCGGCKATPK